MLAVARTSGETKGDDIIFNGDGMRWQRECTVRRKFTLNNLRVPCLRSVKVGIFYRSRWGDEFEKCTIFPERTHTYCLPMLRAKNTRIKHTCLRINGKSGIANSLCRPMAFGKKCQHVRYSLATALCKTSDSTKNYTRTEQIIVRKKSLEKKTLGNDVRVFV